MMELLNQKMRILSKENTVLEDTANTNDKLGNQVMESFSEAIRPLETLKCRAFATDVGHITGLLLSLSQRLVRAENRLSSSTFDYMEKVTVHIFCSLLTNYQMFLLFSFFFLFFFCFVTCS